MMSYFIKRPRYFIFKLVYLLLSMEAAGQERLADKIAKADSVMEIPDTLLLRIEQAQASINQINITNKRSFQIEIIERSLPAVKRNINEIKKDILTAHRVTDVKTLLSYKSLLEGQQKTLSGWRDRLTAYNKELQEISDRIVTFGSDSLLSVVGKDTSQRRLYDRELTNLRQRLNEAGKQTTTKLDSISFLLADVSNTYFSSAELQNTINEKLQKSGETAFGKESPYIWAAPGTVSSDELAELLKITYQGQNRILSFFFKNSWGDRFLLILLGICYFIWVYRNFRKTKRSPYREKLATHKFEFLYPVPVLSTLIIILNLAPLIEPDSPSLYIELIEFLLLIALTFFFRKHWRRQQFYFWMVIVFLYIAVALANAIVNQGLILRLCLIGINAASLYFGISFYTRIRKTMLLKKFVKPVAFIYILFNGLSILFNIFGRISLSKVFSITAIMGLTQIIGLSAFVQILIEALDLQIKVSSVADGLLSKVNLQRIKSTFRRILAFVAVLLWTIVFVINLNISGPLFSLLDLLLSTERSFGSIKFTIGHILLFAFILYLSNLLQKHIGLLFGEGNATFSAQTTRRSSKLVLVRLIIFVGGFLLAVTAAGFSLNNLTVILGALGVGIGLGMQNIVNNFVSGIILIFEKPFQVGDFIELADKKGQVKDIGIRSSKLVTQQGSEVIVPNGDLLSGRLVNWTLSNTYIKTEIVFKIEIAADFNQVKKIVEEEVNKAEDSVKNIPPELLYNAFSADSVELKIQVWITSIYSEASYKSKLLFAIYKRLNDKNIKMM